MDTSETYIKMCDCEEIQGQERKYSDNIMSHLRFRESMEQLWLAFVMKEKYDKVWDGEKWE